MTTEEPRRDGGEEEAGTGPNVDDFFEGRSIRNLLVEAPAAIAILRGPDHVVMFSNPANNRGLGRDPTGRSVREFPEAEEQGYLALLDRVYRGETISARESRLLIPTPVGPQERFIDFVYQPWRGSDGAIAGVAIFGFDVTSNVRARRSAEEAARRLSILARVSRALSEATVDLGSIYHAVACLLTEQADDHVMIHLLEDDCLRLITAEHRDPEVRATLRQHLSPIALRLGDGVVGRVAATGDSVLVERPTPEELSVQHAATYSALLERFPVQSLLSVPIRVRGRVVGVLSLSRHQSEPKLTHDDCVLLEDVADRAALAISAAQHHQKLVESERRFRTLAEAVPEFIWTSSPDGSVDYFNQRWYEYTGLGPDESLGTAWLRVVHEEDVAALLEVWKQSVDTGCDCEFQCRIRRAADGSYRWMLGRCVPVRDGAGHVTKWVGALTDIHAQKESERAKAEAIKVRDDFLSIAGHELRTPLAALQLQVQSLERLAERNVERERVLERLRKVEHHVARLDRLVSELLNVTRIASGRLELQKEPVDLVALVASVVERFAPQIAATHSPVTIQAPGSVVGNWDGMRVDQVVTNLLGNALKYGAGKPIEVGVFAIDGRARLVVRDHGIGIPPEHQARIFERFQRAVSDRHYGGLGLGLWITRQVVEAHGGTIGLESKPGEGTTFVVELPCREGP
ncbi:MAG: ATP-binding protein [Pseudomonadota bacterium]